MVDRSSAALECQLLVDRPFSSAVCFTLFGFLYKNKNKQDISQIRIMLHIQDSIFRFQQQMTKELQEEKRKLEEESATRARDPFCCWIPKQTNPCDSLDPGEFKSCC